MWCWSGFCINDIVCFFTEDVERKRKSEVATDEADGATAEGVSSEKKAKLEEKSEDGGVAAEAPSNGEQGVVA